jgi:hypothetical protein
LVHGGRVVTGGEPLRIDPERGSEGTGEPPPARVQETHAFVPGYGYRAEPALLRRGRPARQALVHVK